MRTLKGQNFRILENIAAAGETQKWRCIAMSTNCTVTLGTTTEDNSTKDDVGGAARPTVNSKNWQVDVESFNVADTAAILSKMKNGEQFLLEWTDVSAVDNQTPVQHAAAPNISRYGAAYLSDATFTFNDRESSVKNLQFTGAEPLRNGPGTGTTQLVDASAYTKGQFVRLFLSDEDESGSVVAAAKQLSLHVSVTMESATTKDTELDWEVMEPTGLSYEITSNALVGTNEIITSEVGGVKFEDLEYTLDSNTLMYWRIANVSGANNRTQGSVIVKGQAYVTQLSLQAQNRQTATYTATLSGYGDYTVGAFAVDVPLDNNESGGGNTGGGSGN